MRKWPCLALSLLCLPLVLTHAQTGPETPPGRIISALLPVLVHKAAIGRPGATRPDQSVPTPATEIDFTWSYKPNLPACADTRKKCYDGFTLTYVATGTVIASQSTLDPATVSYNWAPKGGVPYGSLHFTLVANGYDEFGNPVASSPAEAVIQNDVTSLAAPTVLPDLTGVPIS